MGFKKNSPVIVPLTKTLADEYWTMPRCFCERPISPTRLKLLKKDLERGPKLTFQWAKAVCRGAEFRINGQCSSKIYSEGILPIPKNAKVLIETFTCDTLGDVAAAWDAYDSKIGTRTSTDIVSAFTAADPMLRDIPLDVSRAAVWGVRLAGGLNAQMVPDDLGRLISDNRDFLVFYRGVVATNGRASNGASMMRAPTRRAPVVAAMFMTWRRDSLAAKSFWDAVHGGDVSSPRDPQRVLREYLLTTTLQAGAAGFLVGEPRSTMLEKCLRAWNAWRQNRTLSVLKSLRQIPEIV